MSESDILLTWRGLVSQIVADLPKAAPLLERAEALIEELPSESPLRLRFAQELQALRRRVLG